MQYDLDFNKWIWSELHSAFNDPSQYGTIDTGRGGGKTFGAFLWLLEELFTTDATTALWVDTVQNNIDAYVEQYLKEDLLKAIWPICKYNYQRKRLLLPGNRFIQFASAEKPQNAEGFRYHRMVLNEGGLILKKRSLWDNTLEPMTHTKDGIANKTRIVGTMKGRNKFWELTMKKDPLWSHYHSTSYNSPLWKKEELDNLALTIPELVFRQEYLSEAIDDAGTVFRNINGCIKNIAMHTMAVLGKSYVMAVDLGKHTDYTVIVVMDAGTKEVVYFDRFNQIDWVYQKHKIFSIWELFGKCSITIDSTGLGDPIFDDLKRLMTNKLHPFNINSVSKKELIEGLSIAIEQSQLSYPNIEVLVDELKSYSFEMTRSGNITYNAPEGYHDDSVIALALAWFQVKEPLHKISFVMA